MSEAYNRYELVPIAEIILQTIIEVEVETEKLKQKIKEKSFFSNLSGNSNIRTDVITVDDIFELLDASNSAQSDSYASPPSQGVQNGGRWISVEDGLPEKNKYVVAYINGGTDHKYCRVVRFNGGVNWYGDSQYSHVVPNGLHNVTHWMELPEPPNI